MGLLPVSADVVIGLHVIYIELYSTVPLRVGAFIVVGVLSVVIEVIVE